ncbi:hypothetical protein THOM_1470, partial [Trachipleistophora hominis]
VTRLYVIRLSTASIRRCCQRKCPLSGPRGLPTRPVMCKEVGDRL